MKKINRSFLQGFNWLLIILLSILGFSGCNMTGPDEYGTPQTDYVVKGKVIDSQTKRAIPGIKVGDTSSLPIAMYGTIPVKYQTFLPDTTDANGNYEIHFTDSSGNPVNMLADDFDGAENGSYNNKIVGVDLENAVKTKDGKGWNNGEYTVTQNIELDPEDE